MSTTRHHFLMKAAQHEAESVSRLETPFLLMTASSKKQVRQEGVSWLVKIVADGLWNIGLSNEIDTLAAQLAPAPAKTEQETLGSR